MESVAGQANPSNHSDNGSECLASSHLRIGICCVELAIHYLPCPFVHGMIRLPQR